MNRDIGAAHQSDHVIRAGDVLRALRVMTPLMLAHPGPLLASVLAATISRVGATVVAGLGAYLVGRTVAGDRPEPVAAWVAALCALALLVGLARWLENWWSHVYAFRIVAELRVEVYRAVNRLSPAYLMRRPSSEAATLIMSEAERLEWLYAHIVPLAVATLIASGAGITVMWQLDPGLGAIMLTAALVLVLVPLVAGRLARRQGARLRESIAAMHLIATDGIQGMRDLLVSGGLPGFARRIAEADRSLLSSKLRYGRRSGLEAATSDLTQAAAVIAVLALAGSLTAAGRLSGEVVPFVIVLAGAVLGPLAMFVANSLQLGEVFGCAVRVSEVLTADPIVRAPAQAKPVDLTGRNELVKFDDVTFAYPTTTAEAADPSARDLVLEGVSFTVSRGETVAVTGMSGGGKSTCAALLVRFFDPTDGTIRLGGTDLRDLNPESIRDTVGLVTQETYLLHGTLRENLRLGDPCAGDGSILAAADMARLTDLIDRLPAGLDTVIDENGASLSGGERQRIAIARMLLREPEVLVLDEATTGLDPETDAALWAGLRATSADRATVTITHRRSGIAAADRVIVLDDGRIVEDGTPGELLARDDSRLRALLDDRAPQADPDFALASGEGTTEGETET